ncbi:aromatic amino acid transporter [Rodentibacter pneumotropicus]|uniref:Aromatic amino acid permease n=2 Tax=Rodentibacter pneumotropicus TaxID=758 RepID=A0A4V3SRI0_9PAST|nr:aromatic amino acid transporter [Rodentibacter pneumotropicus]TGZ99494.1 tyrosine transporter [Rodentibacter pneumotropicus]THA05032.1 tyrosine transporter [Rodentibacter pneumotropicus]THA11286.1 tyrosine transporter [Rodentibacter pneumotropicus]
MNKTLGSTLITSGTMIGAGMLAMPLTSAGMGLMFTILLLCILWVLLTYSALLFVEVYQTAEYDAGIGTLASQYFGRLGRIVTTSILMIFLYALLSAYVTGGGSILASTLPDFAMPNLKMKASILLFTIFFGIFIIIGTQIVDILNRILFVSMLLALLVVLGLMIPEIKLDNLMAMPIDNALLISASPVFFTAFGFHGSIPCLNKYLEGDVKALRISIIFGSAITLIGYILWQCSTHGVLSQTKFLEILHQDPTLNGLIEAVRIITGSSIIAGIVKIFSALALITSFLGVALGLLECIEDLLKSACNISANRLCLGFLTFLPPLLFAFFYPEGFILALGYAGQMFTFYAVVLPAALVWKARKHHPNLPYRVIGGKSILIVISILGIIIVNIPFFIKLGFLPVVIG